MWTICGPALKIEFRLIGLFSEKSRLEKSIIFPVFDVVNSLTEKMTELSGKGMLSRSVSSMKISIWALMNFWMDSSSVSFVLIENS